LGGNFHPLKLTLPLKPIFSLLRFLSANKLPSCAAATTIPLTESGGDQTRESRRRKTTEEREGRKIKKKIKKSYKV
jgi:hypothetical protein